MKSLVQIQKIYKYFINILILNIFWHGFGPEVKFKQISNKKKLLF